MLHTSFLPSVHIMFAVKKNLSKHESQAHKLKIDNEEKKTEIKTISKKFVVR